MLKTYGAAPYAAELKKLEKEIKDKQQSVNEKIGGYFSILWLNSYGLTFRRCKGVGHRTSTSPPMGYSSRQATHARRTTSAGGTVYQDYTR